MTYVAYLNWLMLTRLVTVFWPGKLAPGTVVIATLAQLVGLGVFTPSLAVVGVGCCVVVFQLPLFGRIRHRELGQSSEAEPRLLPLLGTALAGSFLFGSIEFAPGVVDLVSSMARASITLRGLNDSSFHTFNTVLFGLLLLTNEVNVVIRWLLRLVQREPTPALLGSQSEATARSAPTTAEAEAEYNAGRVIGIVERYLMFGVIFFSDNYEALAFILAAKGFARFKQMEQRAYAEYVLIGTLLSTLSAIAVAELVRHVLQSKP